MESFNLAFETKELMVSINENKNFIISKDRKAWFNNYPKVIDEINDQLRKYFKIPIDRKMVFSFYEMKNKNLKIHQEKENIVNRIIISTIDDEIKTNKGDTYLLNSWEAYILPTKFKNSTDIYFNKKIKNKKLNGLRQRKIFNDSERFIMVFEYVFNKEEISKFLNFNNESTDEIDESVKCFLNS